MAASSIPESKVGEKIILDSRQLEFIKYQQGCAVLHAPVGTGKTLVLAIRASEAIQSGVDPSKILCVTFTNRAADELRQRVAMKCGRSARHVVVRTFHSLCTWMLRCEAKQIGLPADFVIYDDDDSIEIIKECAKTLGINLTIKGYINEARDVLNLISSAKVDAPPKAYATSSVPEAVFQGLNPVQCRLALAYQDKLATHHALDFADLIYFTRAMLFTRLDIYKRWATRFSMIQVDEMQDTHMSEYQVLSVLAQGCKNMVLAGDFDQTIYEWRGSAPEQVLKLFKKEFQEVREFSFTTNYRTTRTLVDAAVHVASRYSTCERICPSSAAEEGEPVVFHFANDSPLEAAWVAKKVLSLKRASEYRSRDKSLCLSRVGVLTRTNSRAIAISEAFANAGIPHITVEQFEFFRRQEVKDAVAYLKFLFNPFDGRSLHRMLLRPPRNIGKRTIERIQAVEEMGLRLIDMVKPSTLELGDPFAQLLRELEYGSIVIFDTETTGLNPATDEIVEIGAMRLERGRITDTFHRYLRNSASVGDTLGIHGLSDQFLYDKGVDRFEALTDFLAFADESLLVGHNVTFDVRMLFTNARRLKIDPGKLEFADTLDIARRFIDTDNYSLDNLADCLDISVKPTHRAMDDVSATSQLIKVLAPCMRKELFRRTKVVNEVGTPFVSLAEEIQNMRALAERIRPHELLCTVLEESGLNAYYNQEPKRMNNLYELVKVFRNKDDANLDPTSSLENILNFTSLARNVDRIDPEDERVRILTVHQSKGLEFDVVFLAGLSEHEFPGYMAVRDNRQAEELRVYVALTRARRRLFLTGHAMNNGKRRNPSPYFTFLGDGWIEEGSNAIRRRYGRRWSN